MTPGFLFSNHLAFIMERSLVVLYDNLQVSRSGHLFSLAILSPTLLQFVGACCHGFHLQYQATDMSGRALSCPADKL
jgi:hypothetical protein